MKKSSYFQDIKQEMKKVSWTTKEELRTCTKIVIGTIFVLGFGVYFVDLAVHYSLQLIGILIHLLG